MRFEVNTSFFPVFNCLVIDCSDVEMLRSGNFLPTDNDKQN